MLSVRNAKCSNPSSLDSNIFKYPPNVVPGDVFPIIRSRVHLFTPGTVLFQIVDVILPNIIGSLIFLFFLSTSVFLCFSVLRLMYLDKLKPYKLKKLRALGKHHHYYRHQGDFEGKKVKRVRRKSNTRLLKRNGKDEVDDEDEDDVSLTHPPGQQLSYTAPPWSSAHGETYPEVIDLMHGNNKATLPQLSHFPSEFPRLYTGGKGQGSRIPILVNKRHTAWGWTSDWYRKQLIDENKTAEAVHKLQASRSLLSTRVSEKLSIKPSYHEPRTPTTLSREFIEPVQTLYRAPSPLNEPLPSSPEPDIQERKVELALPPRPPPSPPPVTPDRLESNRIKPTVPDNRSYYERKQSIASRYTFRLQGITSTLHTEIPKQQSKKCCNKLMILRAGPRKKASQIEVIRQQRKSSGANESPASLLRQKVEDKRNTSINKD
ncbi:unnamed protein product [Orchesella dallaii]|uniref:Uncharacterized protein n=1 Tax=Orchesella dallaii TaxID=48710 RepID=A0ABP1PSH2_9HEXA